MSAPLLICLPPAGAGPSLFHPWRRADADVLAPPIPGREARYAEPAPESLEALADHLARDLSARLHAPFALFGYSMGGVVAYLLARRLAHVGGPAPRAVFLLGAPAPSRLGGGVKDMLDLPSDAFWRELARIGGAPPEVLNHAEMRALLEPGLRADFQLCAEYRRAGDFRLSCPTHLFLADQDHFVDAEDAAAWKECCAASFRLHRLRGLHILAPEAFATLRETVRALLPEAAHANAHWRQSDPGSPLVQ